MRKDAAENRDKLLTAARRVFGERGIDATLNDVAREAGVGVGTAYRNFANKQELLEALFARQVDELEAILTQCLAMDDPWECLEYYLRRSLALQYADHATAQIFAGRFVSQAAHDLSRDRMAPLVNRVGERCGVPGTDLILIQIAVLATADIMGKGYERYLDLALAGLKTGEKSPIPALTTEELHEATGRGCRD